MESAPHAPACSQKNFSLIEGLLAIVLIAIILVGAAPFFYFSRYLIERSKLTREAVELATREQEDLLGLPFDQLVDCQQNVQLDGTAAVMTTTVQDVVIDGEGNGYRQVTVHINWMMGAKSQNVSLVTYISSASGVH